MEAKNILDQVTLFASQSHGDQKRKYTPEPYIVHPVRVMKILTEYTDDVCILSAAILHDVLEDTPVTLDKMYRFMTGILDPESALRTVNLVVELTDVYTKKSYPQYNRKKRKQLESDRIEKTSAHSQTIKYADIIDNCNEIVVYDQDFAHVFLHECRLQLRKINKGDFRLYTRAINAVELNLAQLKNEYLPNIKKSVS
jgi:guanosine-3',5'-bis(diphosphate) 3'-pyrophosphohydrolase